MNQEQFNDYVAPTLSWPMARTLIYLNPCMAVRSGVVTPLSAYPVKK